MEQEEIVTKYVWNGNVYGALMNGNISREEYKKDNKQLSVQIIQEMVSQNGAELIDALLEIQNWRAKTIAGCLIGFKNQPQYVPQIGELFLNQCGGVTGYTYTFAKFANEESINFLQSYLNRYLKFEKFPEEKFQDWAFSALRWIDKTQNTHYGDEYLGTNGLWTSFIDFKIIKRKLSDFERWGNLEAADIRFKKMMNFYKANFEIT